MYVKCEIDYCRHWSKEYGDFEGEGGCTLNIITITDEKLTPCGYIPQCEDFEEKSRSEK